MNACNTFLSGIGGALGYTCIAINWEKTIFGQALGSQLRVVFLLNVIVFLIPLILTLTSIPEVPLRRPPSLSQSETKYVPCNSGDERTARKVSADAHGKSQNVGKRKMCSLWGFIKWFYRKKPTGNMSQESVERTTLSGDDVDEGSHPYCDGEQPHKHIRSCGKFKKQRISKGKDSLSSGHNASSGGNSDRKLFVPKKKVKATSKKSEAGSTSGSNCILKINPNDDMKDLLNSTAKMPAGSFSQNTTMHQCNDSSQSLAICISNPSVEINCGDDEEVGESDDDDDNKGQPPSVLQLLRSTIYMPKELRFLSLINFLGWAGIITLLCFFTDFVAQAVYHGKNLKMKLNIYLEKAI